jgi:hypothetical protein
MQSPPRRAVTIEERIDRLTGIVNTAAGSVVANDHQSEPLIQAAEKNERQWPADINTLPR